MIELTKVYYHVKHYCIKHKCIHKFFEIAYFRAISLFFIIKKIMDLKPACVVSYKWQQTMSPLESRNLHKS